MVKTLSFYAGLALASIVAIGIASCDTYPPSEPFDMSEVPGEYKPLSHYESEYITLLPDSTYEACYHDFKGRLYLERGRWAVRGDDKGYFRITFSAKHDTIIYLDPNLMITPAERDSVRSPLFNNVAYKKWHGDLYIVFGLSRQYKKQVPAESENKR